LVRKLSHPRVFRIREKLPGRSGNFPNQDTQIDAVGPFVVPAGGTITERFTHSGKLRGIGNLHLNGQLTILVRQ
jgi:hypothetical protein